MDLKSFNIEFIQELYDISWELLDFCRDRRQKPTEGAVFKPKKHINEKTLIALSKLSKITSHILATYNKPDADYEGDIPEEIVAEVDLSDKVNRPPLTGS